MTPLFDRNFKYLFVKLSLFCHYFVQNKIKEFRNFSNTCMVYTKCYASVNTISCFFFWGGGVVKSLDDRICKKIACQSLVPMNL